MTTERVMLLIDADNVSVDVMEQAVRLLMNQHGAVHVRRAYCTAESAVKHQAVFKRLSIKPMVNLSAGKNSTDIALAVDAVDLVLAERPDVVVIASSDSDFAPLVARLREKGCVVRGIGQEGKTGDETQDAYDDFTVLAHRKLPGAAAPRAAAGAAAPARRGRAAGGGRAAAAPPPKSPEAPKPPPPPQAGKPAQGGRDAPRGGRAERSGRSGRPAPAPAPASTPARAPSAADQAEDDAAAEATLAALRDATRRAAEQQASAASAAIAAPTEDAAGETRAQASDDDGPAGADDRALDSDPTPPAAPVKKATRKTATRKTAARKTASAQAGGDATPARKTAARKSTRAATASRTATAAQASAAAAEPVPSVVAALPLAEAEALAAQIAATLAAPVRGRAPEAVPAASTKPAPGAAPDAASAAAAASVPGAARTARPAPASAAVAALPDKVLEILASLPELARGDTVELRLASQRMRDAGLLGKSASSAKLLGQFADRFELLPPGQPNHVRLRGGKLI